MSIIILLSFIGILLLIFTTGSLGDGNFIVVAFTVVGLVLYCFELLRSYTRGQDYAQQSSVQSQQAAEDKEKLSEENRHLADKLEKCEEHMQQQRDIISELSAQCMSVSKGSDITQKLTEVVQEKTEESTLEFTNRVYEVLELSGQLNRAIQQVVGALSSEQEGSLSQDVLLLESEQQKIESLTKDFIDIRGGYSAEVEKIKSNLSSIGKFVGAISDLADRTNVLAINASIEAARAGRGGDGFAVIGTEIQKLSHNTKEIAEQINSTIQSSVTSVSNSVEQYSAKIGNAVNRLEQSGNTYAALISKLNPQIGELSQIVGTSDELSTQIQENVDEITVHLQYQDRIKQILAHLLQILQDIGLDAEKSVRTCGQELQKDEHKLYSKMVEKASRYFSCDEEYAAFGLENEKIVNQTERAESEFAGDVELF